MRALLRLIHRIEDSEPIRAPAGIFDRVRTAAAEQHGVLLRGQLLPSLLVWLLDLGSRGGLTAGLRIAHGLGPFRFRLTPG